MFAIVLVYNWHWKTDLTTLFLSLIFEKGYHYSTDMFAIRKWKFFLYRYTWFWNEISNALSIYQNMVTIANVCHCSVNIIGIKKGDNVYINIVAIGKWLPLLSI